MTKGVTWYADDSDKALAQMTLDALDAGVAVRADLERLWGKMTDEEGLIGATLHITQDRDLSVRIATAFVQYLSEDEAEQAVKELAE